MWKLAVGFVIFAALAIFVIMKGGDKLDMGGEKHGDVVPVEAPASAAPLPASAPSMPASAASG